MSEYPSARRLRRLQSLLRRRNTNYQRLLALDDELYLEILKAREEGVAVRMLADVLGVSPSTVQEWTKRGRQLRG